MIKSEGAQDITERRNKIFEIFGNFLEYNEEEKISTLITEKCLLSFSSHNGYCIASLEEPNSTELIS